MPSFHISLLHTHFIPLGLRHFVSGVVVAEQKHENLAFYYGGIFHNDISILEFFLRFSKRNSIYSIEGDINPSEVLQGLGRFARMGLRYVLPWRRVNPEYFRYGACTKDAVCLLTDMSMRGIVLDCSHMPESVLVESLKYYDGPVVFSHSVFRLPQTGRKRISNEITSGMVDRVRKRDFLIGIPLINDMIARQDPIAGECVAKIEDVVDQIVFAIKEVGVDHVCIGGDYFNFEYYTAKYGCSLGTISNLDSIKGFTLLWNRLRDNGLTDNEIEHVFFRNVELFNARIEADVKRKSISSEYWSFSTENAGSAQCERVADVECVHPTHAWIALNNYCNLSCRHCRRTYSTNKPSEKDVSDVLYERIFSEVLPGLKSLIIGGNNFAEVTKAVRFKDFVCKLYSVENRPRISVQTNGSAIPIDVLEMLIDLDVVLNISVEGGVSETAKRIRGLGLDFIERRLSLFNQLRRAHKESHSRSVLSFTAMKSTIHELPQLLEFAELNGVDEVNLLYMLPPTKEWNDECVFNDSVRVNDIVSKSRELASGWNVELIAPELAYCEKDLDCTRPWTSTSIDAYGDVRFCCLNESPIIGNLLERHFGEIWNSTTARTVRGEVNIAPSAECQRCVIRNLPQLSIHALAKHLK